MSNTITSSISCTYSVCRFLFHTAMAEWHSKGFTRFGTGIFLRQTNCDFIDDNTCVSVNIAESSGERRQYKSVFVATRVSLQK